MVRPVIVVRIVLAAFLALMLAGPGAAIFPSTLRWASWIACPSGTTPTSSTFTSSYQGPGESSVERSAVLHCVAPDGTRHERTMAAIGGLSLMYFMGLSVLFTFLIRGAPSDPGSRSAPRTPPAPRHVPANTETQARELMAQDQKIHAIKIVRETTGMGLREAKEWVEALEHRAPSATSSSPAPAGPTGIGAVDRLAELKRMLDGGLITLDEFEAKKAQILAEL
ncbi:MAG TPA: ribosomal protein L7/L12 [Longimicrobium sp.]|nr:ribosomal protein L7/L12 [Longimicrobium sp.]